MKVDNARTFSLNFSKMFQVPGDQLHMDHPVVLPNNSTLFIIPLCARSDEQEAAPLEN
jgi:hypothetical protein